MIVILKNGAAEEKKNQLIDWLSGPLGKRKPKNESEI